MPQVSRRALPAGHRVSCNRRSCQVPGGAARAEPYSHPSLSREPLGVRLASNGTWCETGIRQLSRQPLASRSEPVEPGRRRQWSETRWQRGFVGTGNPSHAWSLPALDRLPPSSRPAGAWGTKGAAGVMDPADAFSASVPLPQPTRAAAYHLEPSYIVLLYIADQEHQAACGSHQDAGTCTKYLPMTD